MYVLILQEKFMIMNEEEFNQCSWRLRADLLARVLIDSGKYDEDSYLVYYFAFADMGKAYEWKDLEPQVQEKLNGI